MLGKGERGDNTGEGGEKGERGDSAGERREIGENAGERGGDRAVERVWQE